MVLGVHKKWVCLLQQPQGKQGTLGCKTQQMVEGWGAGRDSSGGNTARDPLRLCASPPSPWIHSHGPHNRPDPTGCPRGSSRPPGAPGTLDGDNRFRYSIHFSYQPGHSEGTHSICPETEIRFLLPRYWPLLGTNAPFLQPISYGSQH